MTAAYVLCAAIGALTALMAVLLWRTARRYADERLREQQLADAHVARYRAEHRQDPL